MLQPQRRDMIDDLFNSPEPVTDALLNEVARKRLNQNSTKPTTRAQYDDGVESVSRRYYIRNKFQIAKYVDQEYDYKYVVTPEESVYYYETGNVTINEPQPDIVFSTEIIQKIKSYRNIVVDSSQESIDLYNDTSRPKDKRRVALLRDISRVMVYLEAVGGRRVNENFKDMVETESGIIFKKSKSGMDEDIFKPLIPVEEFMAIWRSIEPFITAAFKPSSKTIANRTNNLLHFDINSVYRPEVNLTTHTLRKLYAYLCRQQHPDKSDEKAISDCLGHESLRNALFYRNVAVDIEEFEGDRCLICDKVVRTQKLRHTRTRGHQKKLAELNQL